MKRIVRIRKVDLPGERKVGTAICKIKGVNFMMSNAILNALNINKEAIIGELPDKIIDKLKKAINDPSSLNIPQWLFNRLADVTTGSDRHLTGTDIPLTVREDVKRLKDTQSLKGYRHAAGLKVRGQRTKAHPRQGLAVGVVTKKKAAKMMKKDGVKPIGAKKKEGAKKKPVDAKKKPAGGKKE
ncbi:30S ribosomal protein S13 [archaeon]|nr:30S ribosomal protein S13 [archaeon]